MERDRVHKTIAGIFLSCLPAFFCFGCTQPAVSGGTQEALHAVLSGEASLLYTAAKKQQPVKISQVPAILSPNSSYATIWRFAVADLNGDGEAEAILQVIDAAGDMGGYMLLHQEKDAVHGYIAGYRDFENLKTDGTYSCSNPMGTDLSVCRACFDNGSYFPEPIIRCCTQDNWETVSCFIAEKPVSEEAYQAAMVQQDEKQAAEWYTFSEENIQAVFV